ncbi:hypothetical protein RM609_29015, partial [Streptomyces sp. DSM 40473]|nr:hypothetical protein [Streptomyces sp. DSM 40473]
MSAGERGRVGGRDRDGEDALERATEEALALLAGERRDAARGVRPAETAQAADPARETARGREERFRFDFDADPFAEPFVPPEAERGVVDAGRLDVPFAGVRFYDTLLAPDPPLPETGAAPRTPSASAVPIPAPGKEPDTRPMAVHGSARRSGAPASPADQSGADPAVPADRGRAAAKPKKRPASAKRRRAAVAPVDAESADPSRAATAATDSATADAEPGTPPRVAAPADPTPEEPPSPS